MSAGFSEARLDPAISYGFRAVTMRRTQVVALQNASEERVGKWADSRRRYEASFDLREAEVIEAIVAFHEARSGRLFGFRFKDWGDYKSCGLADEIAPTDQVIGTGDGATVAFQLVKTYASGFQQYARPIRKPTPAIRVAVGGVETQAFSVDLTAGVVVLDVPPPIGAAVTAGFEFDVPVRFESDDLGIEVIGPNVLRCDAVTLIEDPRWQSEGEEVLAALDLASPLARLVNVTLPGAL